MKTKQNAIIPAIIAVAAIQMGTNAISPIMADLYVFKHKNSLHFL